MDGNQMPIATKRDRKFQCEKKKNFVTENLANRELEKMFVKLPAWQVARLNVYKCPHCTLFHIGNKPK